MPKLLVGGHRSREPISQFNLGPRHIRHKLAPKWAWPIGDVTKHWHVAYCTHDSHTTFKVKGQGHQAALGLLGAALTRKAAAAVSVGTYSAWQSILLRCVCSAAREAVGGPLGRRGGGILCRHAHSLSRYEIGPWLLWNVNRRCVADRSMSFLMSLSDIERRA